MAVRTLLRFVAPVALTFFIAGCVGPVPHSYRAANPAGECYRNQAACAYDGPYEPGEEQYAEQEARRLNQAEAQRLRRGW